MDIVILIVYRVPAHLVVCAAADGHRVPVTAPGGVRGEVPGEGQQGVVAAAEGGEGGQCGQHQLCARQRPHVTVSRCHAAAAEARPLLRPELRGRRSGKVPGAAPRQWRRPSAEMRRIPVTILFFGSIQHTIKCCKHCFKFLPYCRVELLELL